LRRLFISSSEPSRTLPSLLRTGLLVAVVIVIGDLLANLLLQRIGRQVPSILPGAQNVVGVEGLWQMQGAGIAPVVFTGSSQMQTDVSPHVFDDEVRRLTGRSTITINISFTGAGPQISYQVVKNLFAPAGVKTVIYGIEMRALHKRSGDLVGSFRAAPLGNALFLAPGIEQSTAMWLVQHSTLVRYGAQLRTLMVSGQPEEAAIASDDRGYLPLTGTPPRQGGIILGQFVPFETSDEVRRAFINLARFCQEAGMRCIVANLPLHELAYQLISPSDELLYRSELLNLLAAGKLPLWDFDTAACRSQLGDGAFFDLNHLNSSGAARFTRVLAALYVQQVLGQALPPDNGANCARVIQPS
jgi:hypothetical protein